MGTLPNGQHITYQLQYRKCGKPSCSRCRSSQGHGPYWYAYWRQGSRLHSTYIGKVRPTSLDTSLDRPTSENMLETVADLVREEPTSVEGRSDAPYEEYLTKDLLQADLLTT
jgi:hypothetical protein